MDIRQQLTSTRNAKINREIKINKLKDLIIAQGFFACFYDFTFYILRILFS